MEHPRNFERGVVDFPPVSSQASFPCTSEADVPSLQDCFSGSYDFLPHCGPLTLPFRRSERSTPWPDRSKRFLLSLHFHPLRVYYRLAENPQLFPNSQLFWHTSSHERTPLFSSRKVCPFSAETTRTFGLVFFPIRAKPFSTWVPSSFVLIDAHVSKNWCHILRGVSTGGGFLPKCVFSPYFGPSGGETLLIPLSKAALNDFRRVLPLYSSRDPSLFP